MKRVTYEKLRDALKSAQGHPTRLAVVKTDQGYFLAWQDTLMPDYFFPVDLFDAVTHEKL